MVAIAEVSSKKSICTFVTSINDDHYNFGKESFWMKRRKYKACNILCNKWSLIADEGNNYNKTQQT